jgi:hypothetical protein
VGQSIFFKLFGAGKMPEPIRSSVVGEHPLVFAEGYRGWLRRKGTLPGGIIAGGIRSQMGSFAITPSRVVVTASKHVVVDLRYQDSESANATVSISNEGLQLNVDVAAAVRGGTGKWSSSSIARWRPPTSRASPPRASALRWRSALPGRCSRLTCGARGKSAEPTDHWSSLNHTAE